ncbi:MAG TPA: hypothetical protein VI895_08375 [Bdellovibrionota bacterium]|nr:hypothetical protein [Bdellovibrionota bacterium]
MRRVFKPKRWKLEGREFSAIQKVNNTAAIDRVASQTIGMPSKNSLSFTVFDPSNHLIKNGAAGHLRGHGLGEFSHNMEMFFLRKSPNF